MLIYPSQSIKKIEVEFEKSLYETHSKIIFKMNFGTLKYNYVIIESLELKISAITKSNFIRYIIDRMQERLM